MFGKDARQVSARHGTPRLYSSLQRSISAQFRIYFVPSRRPTSHPLYPTNLVPPCRAQPGAKRASAGGTSPRSACCGGNLDTQHRTIAGVPNGAGRRTVIGRGRAEVSHRNVFAEPCHDHAPCTAACVGRAEASPHSQRHGQVRVGVLVAGRWVVSHGPPSPETSAANILYNARFIYTAVCGGSADEPQKQKNVTVFLLFVHITALDSSGVTACKEVEVGGQGLRAAVHRYSKSFSLLSCWRRTLSRVFRSSSVDRARHRAAIEKFCLGLKQHIYWPRFSDLKTCPGQAQQSIRKAIQLLWRSFGSE